MKKIVFLFGIFFLFLGSIFSQDIIYKRDGSRIQSVVLKITETSIEYQYFNQPDGPVRVLSLKDVYMVRYNDGTEEQFTSEVPEVQPEPEAVSTTSIMPTTTISQPVSTEPIQPPVTTKQKSSGKFSLNAGGFLHMYYNEEMSSTFGTMPLFGLGLGVDMDNIFFTLRYNTGSVKYDEDNWTLKHSQLDLLFDLKWYKSQGSKAQVYSGIGLSLNTLKDEGPDNEKEKGTGAGVLLELGFDILLANNLYLFVTATSVIGNVNIYEEKVNISGERLGVGLKVNFD